MKNESFMKPLDQAAVAHKITSTWNNSQTQPYRNNVAILAFHLGTLNTQGHDNSVTQCYNIPDTYIKYNTDPLSNW